MFTVRTCCWRVFSDWCVYNTTKSNEFYANHGEFCQSLSCNKNSRNYRRFRETKRDQNRFGENSLHTFHNDFTQRVTLSNAHQSLALWITNRKQFMHFTKKSHHRISSFDLDSGLWCFRFDATHFRFAFIKESHQCSQILRFTLHWHINNFFFPIRILQLCCVFCVPFTSTICKLCMVFLQNACTSPNECTSAMWKIRNNHVFNFLGECTNIQLNPINHFGIVFFHTFRWDSLFSAHTQKRLWRTVCPKGSNFSVSSMQIIWSAESSILLLIHCHSQT